MITRLFQFNIFNYYLPYMIVAFNPGNPQNFVELFYLMATQMVFKQIISNVIEYLQPIIKARKKL